MENLKKSKISNVNFKNIFKFFPGKCRLLWLRQWLIYFKNKANISIESSFKKFLNFSETSCIETYAPALVDVLDACLMYRMSAESNNVHDSPHCKIVSEILSTLFLVKDFLY